MVFFIFKIASVSCSGRDRGFFFRNDWGVSDLKSCQRNREPWNGAKPRCFDQDILEGLYPYPPRKFNSDFAPEKLHKNPIGSRIAFQPPIFQGRTVKTLGVYILTKRGGDEKCEPIRRCSSEPWTQNPLIEHGLVGVFCSGATAKKKTLGKGKVSAEFTATVGKTP